MKHGKYNASEKWMPRSGNPGKPKTVVFFEKFQTALEKVFNINVRKLHKNTLDVLPCSKE